MPLFMTCCAIAILPDDLLAELNIYQIKVAYKGFFWILFMLTGANLLCIFIPHFSKCLLSDWFENYAIRRRHLKEVEILLGHLDAGEIVWIRYFLHHNRQRISANMVNEAARSLCRKEILLRDSENCLCINGDIWGYLQKYHSLFLSKDMACSPEFKKQMANFGSLLNSNGISIIGENSRWDSNLE